MDGTLLDRHFDDYFWEHYVPEVYARQNRISIEAAKKELLARYRTQEGKLAWTDLDFWSTELGLDIPALKMKINHLIGVHPYVVDFLKFCRKKSKRIYLVTNAHSKTLTIKMEKTALAGYFDGIICSEEIGVAKEDPDFWARLEKMLGFRREHTMFADDTERVLDSAALFGFGALIYVARPSSSKPVQYSSRYPSILYFKELIEE
ncbi:HAD-IA family hydrolase [Thiovibrio sp. JS02]